MIDNLDYVNGVLAGLRDDGMIEPIDSPTEHVDFWDWADVVGIVDEFVPVEYTV